MRRALAIALTLLFARPAQADWKQLLGKAIACPFKILASFHEPEEEPPTPWDQFRKDAETRKAKEFVAGLEKRGVGGLSVDTDGHPILLTAEGARRIPYFREAPDLALGFTQPPEEGGKAEAPPLLKWALERHAAMWQNYNCVPMPERVPILVEYPETVISGAYKLAAMMDHTIAQGNRIHFNLDRVRVEDAVRVYRRGGAEARATDWELGRLVFALKRNHYPRSQVEFWNGAKRLTREEVDKLLSTFP